MFQSHQYVVSTDRFVCFLSFQNILHALVNCASQLFKFTDQFQEI